MCKSLSSSWSDKRHHTQSLSLGHFLGHNLQEKYNSHAQEFIKVGLSDCAGEDQEGDSGHKKNAVIYHL